MRNLVYSIITLSVYYLNIYEVIGGDFICCGPNNNKCCCKTPNGDQVDIFLDLYPAQSWQTKQDFLAHVSNTGGDSSENKMWRNYNCVTWGNHPGQICNTAK